MSGLNVPTTSEPVQISSTGTDKNEEMKCKTPPNSPWGVHGSTALQYIHKVTPFEQVMSEQLASKLQMEEDKSVNPALNSTEPVNLADFTIDDEMTRNDAILAQIMQDQFDQEQNSAAQERQAIANREKYSKVTISYQNHMASQEYEDDDDYDYDSGDEEYHDFQLKNDIHGQLPFNAKGYCKFGGKIVTKHDLEINGRNNMAKLEDQMPPEVYTGDAVGHDIMLNNRSFNQLKSCVFSKPKQSHKSERSKQGERQEKATAQHSLDDTTKKILNRLVDRGFIGEVYGVINKGKEAVVLHADRGEGLDASETGVGVSQGNANDSHKLPEVLPDEYAIKVYQTTLGEYRCREQYIRDDFRFNYRFKKLNERKIIWMWAEKEMHNLVRMRERGIPCPQVVFLRRHVLLMSFVGAQGRSAPQLKQAALNSEQRASAYRQVVDLMRKLYHECKLVHADLSEYNLLWWQGKVWVIDVSQSVEPNHPHALRFLLRDCRNVSSFFKRWRVADVLEPMNLFNHVSGLDIPVENEQEFIQRTEEMERENHEHAMKRRLRSSKLLEQNATSLPVPPTSTGTEDQTASTGVEEHTASTGATSSSAKAFQEKEE